MVKVLIKKLDPAVEIPIYKTTGASGMDLMAFIREPIKLAPKSSCLVPTGLSVAFSEKYVTDDMRKRVFKKVGMLWWKRYSKNLNAKDLRGYTINEKYEGEWKNGKRDGKGVLIIFQDPEYRSNKDWTPSIEEKYTGMFQNGELHGQIKKYYAAFNEWSLTTYKNGIVGKSIKIKKK